MTAATASPLGETVVGPGNALLEHKGQDDITEWLWRCGLSAGGVQNRWDLFEMGKRERRRNKRCRKNTAIIYSFINQTRQHAAVARNYSRFGMYFESDRPLSPGTTLVIRTLGCDAAGNRHGDSGARGPAADDGEDTQLPSEACRELKTLVVAEVKRCEGCKNLNTEKYGIGVHYVSPAV